jgi:Tfp pilus assembly protein PilN
VIEKLKNIISNTKKNSIGIEVNILAPEKYSFRMIKIEKQADEINIVHTEQDFSSLSRIKEHIKFDTKVSLSIQGKGILNKIIDSSIENQGKSILSQVLPNAKTDDFYIQKTRFGENKILISVVRKTLVESVLDVFSHSNINIFNLLIGHHPIIEMNEFISLQNDFSIGDDFFKIKDNKISDIEKTSVKEEENSIFIGDEKLNTQVLLCFASAFLNLFSHSEGSSLSDEFNFYKDEYKYRVLFRKTGVGTLVFFLFLLIINYLLFQKTNSTINTLDQKLTYSNSLITEKNRLNQDIMIKEKMVKESGFLNSYYHAYMADRLAYTKPKEINLLTLMIQNPSGRYEENEKCIFHNNTIQISGHVVNSKHINTWIDKIESESWVKEVRMIEYRHETEHNKGYFIINIKH